jgi:hypothetical protein
MDDKRASARQRTLKSGKIVFASGSFTIDCIIRNLSELGARLQVPRAVAIPDHFSLVEVETGRTRQAHALWRRGGLMGVRFDKVGG